MFHKEKKSQDMLAGLLIGAAIGAVAGIMLAPKAGHELAHDVVEGTGCLLKQAKSRFSPSSQDDNNPYWLGGILGALLGGASGVLLTPQSGKTLREHISGKYQDVSDRTWQLVNSLHAKGEEVIELVSNRAANWSENLLDIADTVADEVKEWAEVVRDAALEAKFKAEELGQDPAYRNKLTDVFNWSQKAIALADEVTEEAKNWVDAMRQATAQNKNRANNSGADVHHPISDIVEWATIGYNLWQKMQHRR